MATHTYTSWGRTRRPKNVTGNTSTSEITLTSTNGTAPSAVGDGYPTENQRYLHLMIKDADGDTTITVYVYYHAFGNWGKLQIPVFIKNGADTTVDLAYTDATFTCATAYQTYILDISGADRVAFVANNSDACDVYAACSTF